MAERVPIFRPGDPTKSAQDLADLSVALNLFIYERSLTDPRMIYRDPKPKGSPEINIRRTLERCQARFQSVVRQFPYNWQVTRQAAYILRAYSGLQMFPDANHRTGLAISRLHLHAEGYQLKAPKLEYERLVRDLKLRDSPYRSRRTAEKIAVNDACMQRVSDFYGSYTRTTGPSLLARLIGRVDDDSNPMDLALFDEETAEAEAERKGEPAREALKE